MSSYLGVVNIMNTSDSSKNSIAAALAEQIHKNFRYVIKSSSENGYNATVTTQITTFDSDSILSEYQSELDKYLTSADAVIGGSQKRYEKSLEILLDCISKNTAVTVNDVAFVFINDGVSWKLLENSEALGNAIFGTLSTTPVPADPDSAIEDDDAEQLTIASDNAATDSEETDIENPDDDIDASDNADEDNIDEESDESYYE